MSMLRGFVYRVDRLWGGPEWAADLGYGPTAEATTAFLGFFATQPEALDAVCARLAENATARALEAGEVRA